MVPVHSSLVENLNTGQEKNIPGTNYTQICAAYAFQNITRTKIHGNQYSVGWRVQTAENPDITLNIKIQGYIHISLSRTLIIKALNIRAARSS